MIQFNTTKCIHKIDFNANSFQPSTYHQTVRHEYKNRPKFIARTWSTSNLKWSKPYYASTCRSKIVIENKNENNSNKSFHQDSDMRMAPRNLVI